MSVDSVVDKPPIIVAQVGSSRAHQIGSVVPKALQPKQGTAALQCHVEIRPGVRVRVTAWGNNVLVDGAEQEMHTRSPYQFIPWTHKGRLDVNTVEPFATAEVISGPVEGCIEREKRNIWSRHREMEKVTNCYWTGSRHTAQIMTPGSPGWVPYQYLTIRVTLDDGRTATIELPFKYPTTGVATLTTHDARRPMVKVTVKFFGKELITSETLADVQDRNGYNIRGMAVLYRHLGGSELPDGADAWWDAYITAHPHKTDMKGLASIFKRKAFKPILERLKADEPVAFKFLLWLTSSKTSEGKRNNQLLSAFIQETGTDYDAMVAGLLKARNVTAPTTGCSYYRLDYGADYEQSTREICLSLPGAAEKVLEEEAKKDYTKRKGASKQADGLGVTKDNYPKLFDAISSGGIPMSVFQQPSSKQPVNREFALWERALKQKGWSDVIFEISKSAGGRGTYDKDITPFLMFLFQLPKYLDRHTEGRKKWRAMPKFVKSQWDLEMEDQNDEGTVKRRSAFTPVADNDERVVTVPYVAVSVSGVRTQWCYAQYFYIFEEGFTDPESHGMVLRDLEPKLNGRDDYGLVYYTLTGTMTARGYPTFLTIFERRKNGTFVHFHRVRPSRSKKGVKTPACELVGACYQYMAGNIPASDIEAQQGDLMFIQHGNDPIAAKAKVAPPQEAHTMEFESHKFISADPSQPLKLYRSTAKTPKNRLGFLYTPVGFRVAHPEHDDLEYQPGGWYEIRRCKSYENNPVAIWSLTID